MMIIILCYSFSKRIRIYYIAMLPYINNNFNYKLFNKSLFRDRKLVVFYNFENMVLHKEVHIFGKHNITIIFKYKKLMKIIKVK